MRGITYIYIPNYIVDCLLAKSNIVVFPAGISLELYVSKVMNLRILKAD